MSEPSEITKGADAPLLELSLFRLTLETDDKETFDILTELFSKVPLNKVQNHTNTLYWTTIVRHIIGVESRVRERLER